MRNSKLACSLALLASTMLIAPPGLGADDRTEQRSIARDMALDAAGNLQGQVVDPQGKGLDAVQVKLMQNAQELGRTTTDKAGKFQFAGTRNGLYDLDVAGQTTPVRVWSAQIAPPTAKAGVTIVQGNPAVRGQFGFMDPMNTSILLLGVAGVTLSAISLGEINDTQRQNRSLQQQLRDLQNQLQSP